MMSLSHYDFAKVEREYEKLRIHLAADLCRLNTVLPLALMLRRHEIDRVAHDLVQAVRRAPYRRQGPLVVRLMEEIFVKASSALHRNGPVAPARWLHHKSGPEDGDEPRYEELTIVFGDVPSMPFEIPRVSTMAGKIPPANTNRPRFID